MKRKLLISGVTLGACVLAVSVIMSGAPSVMVPPSPATVPPIVDMAASAPSESSSQTSTDTDQIIVAFSTSPSSLTTAARQAVGPAAATLASANVTDVDPITDRSASVTLSRTISRHLAARVARAAEDEQGVDYAVASANFYPTSEGGSYSWDMDQVNAPLSLASSLSGLSDVVVGVIDTGIADNAYLPKALLVDSSSKTIWGKSLTGTTWPKLTVTINYTGVDNASHSAKVQAGTTGRWSTALDPTAKDGTELTASVTDQSGFDGGEVKLTVDATTNLFATSPINTDTITGTSDADAHIVITDSNDTTVCETDATGAETFECTVSPEVSAGTEATFTVTATDTLDNSDSVEVTIDKQPPSAPTISPNPSAGYSIVVTDVSEGDTPQLRRANGDTAPAGSWSGPSAGVWTFTPDTRLSESDESR